eukprot:5547867-Pleurochrysis_carterae.AAC.1
MAYNDSTARSYCARTTQFQVLPPSVPAPFWAQDQNCQFSQNLGRVFLVRVDPGALKGAGSLRLQQALMACTTGGRRLQKVGTAGQFCAQTLQP